MSIDSTQQKRSPCGKLMQLMRSFFELSPIPVTGTHVRSSASLSPPHNHHGTIKQPKTPVTKPRNSRYVDGLDGGGSSSFIKIQGIDHHDIRREDDSNSYDGMQTTDELKASITNLKASDYIRRFHERNKHESVSLVLPPPPPPLPPPRQVRK